MQSCSDVSSESGEKSVNVVIQQPSLEVSLGKGNSSMGVSFGGQIARDIPPGYYNTSDATATGDKIVSGYTAYGANGKLSGTYQIPDWSKVTATPEQVRKGSKFYDSTGALVGGTLRVFDKLAQQNLGTINYSSTSAGTIGKTISLSGLTLYDCLLVLTEKSDQTFMSKSSGVIYLTGSNRVNTKNGAVVGNIGWTEVWNGVQPNATPISYASTTKYGIYPYSATFSGTTLSIKLFARAHGTYTLGAIYGTFITTVYGINLFN